MKFVFWGASGAMESLGSATREAVAAGGPLGGLGVGFTGISEIPCSEDAVSCRVNWALKCLSICVAGHAQFTYPFQKCSVKTMWREMDEHGRAFRRVVIQMRGFSTLVKTLAPACQVHDEPVLTRLVAELNGGAKVAPCDAATTARGIRGAESSLSREDFLERYKVGSGKLMIHRVNCGPLTSSFISSFFAFDRGGPPSVEEAFAGCGRLRAEAPSDAALALPPYIIQPVVDKVLAAAPGRAARRAAAEAPAYAGGGPPPLPPSPCPAHGRCAVHGPWGGDPGGFAETDGRTGPGPGRDAGAGAASEGADVFSRYFARPLASLTREARDLADRFFACVDGGAGGGGGGGALRRRHLRHTTPFLVPATTASQVFGSHVDWANEPVWPVQLFLVRHGQQAFSPQPELFGLGTAPGVPLTLLGQVQSLRAAELLATWTARFERSNTAAIATSCLTRARETAALIAEVVRRCRPAAGEPLVNTSRDLAETLPLGDVHVRGGPHAPSLDPELVTLLTEELEAEKAYVEASYWALSSALRNFSGALVEDSNDPFGHTDTAAAAQVNLCRPSPHAPSLRTALRSTVERYRCPSHSSSPDPFSGAVRKCAGCYVSPNPGTVPKHVTGRSVNLIVVSHGNTIRNFIIRELGLPQDFWRQVQLPHGACVPIGMNSAGVPAIIWGDAGYLSRAYRSIAPTASAVELVMTHRGGSSATDAPEVEGAGKNSAAAPPLADTLEGPLPLTFTPCIEGCEGGDVDQIRSDLSVRSRLNNEKTVALLLEEDAGDWWAGVAGHVACRYDAPPDLDQDVVGAKVRERVLLFVRAGHNDERDCVDGGLTELGRAQVRRAASWLGPFLQSGRIFVKPSRWCAAGLTSDQSSIHQALRESLITLKEGLRQSLGDIAYEPGLLQTVETLYPENLFAADLSSGDTAPGPTLLVLVADEYHLLKYLGSCFGFAPQQMTRFHWPHAGHLFISVNAGGWPSLKLFGTYSQQDPCQITILPGTNTFLAPVVPPQQNMPAFPAPETNPAGMRQNSFGSWMSGSRNSDGERVDGNQPVGSGGAGESGGAVDAGVGGGGFGEGAITDGALNAPPGTPFGAGGINPGNQEAGSIGANGDPKTDAIEGPGFVAPTLASTRLMQKPPYPPRRLGSAGSRSAGESSENGSFPVSRPSLGRMQGAPRKTGDSGGLTGAEASPGGARISAVAPRGADASALPAPFRTAGAARASSPTQSPAVLHRPAAEDADLEESPSDRAPALTAGFPPHDSESPAASPRSRDLVSNSPLRAGFRSPIQRAGSGQQPAAPCQSASNGSETGGGTARLTREESDAADASVASSFPNNEGTVWGRRDSPNRPVSPPSPSPSSSMSSLDRRINLQLDADAGRDPFAARSDEGSEQAEGLPEG